MVALWLRYDARQKAALAQFVAAHLRLQLTQSVSRGKRRTQRVLSLLALALLFVALAGPQLGFRWEKVSSRGNEIVFAVDTSRSMLTPDVKPDRLTRAKLAIDDFANQLDGDAVGLVAFAGTAFLVCPITLDYGAFHESVNSLDTNTIARGGTNITAAIHEAQSALRRRPGSDRILILVTDGEDLEGDAIAAAKAAADSDGLKIYTIGVGTPNGELIPVAGATGVFVKDESGRLVKSKLDDAALQEIAAASGGTYAPLGQQAEGLESLYRTTLGPLAKHDIASRQQKIYTERYQWPLAASLLFLLMSLMVGTRRSRLWSWSERRRARRANAETARVATAAVALLILAALPTASTHASTSSAEEAYKKGDYSGAEKAYAEAARGNAKPVLAFNSGAAAYKAGQFPQAAKAFQDSISGAPSNEAKRLSDQQDAYYNLGNALYRTGQKTEENAPQDTIKQWTDAVKAYDTALQLKPNDPDSKYNRELVNRKLEALKKKQPPQSSQNNQQNPSQNGQNGQGQGQPGQNPSQNSPQNPPQTPPPSANQPPKQDPPPDKPQNGGQPLPQDPKGAPGQPPAGQPPPKGDPKPQPGSPGHEGDADEQAGDKPREPGQMSREEARQLLDSVKGDEKHALRAPSAQQDPNDPTPDKPFKNW